MLTVCSLPVRYRRLGLISVPGKGASYESADESGGFIQRQPYREYSWDTDTDNHDQELRTYDRGAHVRDANRGL